MVSRMDVPGVALDMMRSMVLGGGDFRSYAQKIESLKADKNSCPICDECSDEKTSPPEVETPSEFGGILFPSLMGVFMGLVLGFCFSGRRKSLPTLQAVEDYELELQASSYSDEPTATNGVI